MGNVTSLGNSIIFPAPPSSYDEQLNELIWIPKHFGQLDRERPSRLVSGVFPALYLPAPNPTKHVIIYLHGNSCDIGQIRPELRLLSHELNVTMVAVEYPGYGISPDSATTTGSAIDFRVMATFKFLLSLGVKPSSIILFGRSIGTGPAAALAARLKTDCIQCGGVILQAPFISIHRIVQDYFYMGAWLVENFWDTENSLQVMGPSTPLLLIHGIIDEIIPVYHGQTLFESYKSKLKMADFQPASKHNVYSILDDLVVPIRKFLSTLSLAEKNDFVDIKIPDWCIYNCKGLVNGYVGRQHNINGSGGPPIPVIRASSGSSTARAESIAARSTNEGRDSFSTSTGKCEETSEDFENATRQGYLGKQINRNIKKSTFSSSLEELRQKNSINSEDILDMVNDAISRNRLRRNI